MDLRSIARIFLKVGCLSFGGWSTMAALLEDELVKKRQAVSDKHFTASVAYSQVLPGATQIAIAASLGQRLAGLRGALTATFTFLLPPTVVFTVFSYAYFTHAKNDDITALMGGTIAVLTGIILANAYRLSTKHISHYWLWPFVYLAFGMQFFASVHIFIIILSFAALGLLASRYLGPPSERS